MVTWILAYRHSLDWLEFWFGFGFMIYELIIGFFAFTFLNEAYQEVRHEQQGNVKAIGEILSHRPNSWFVLLGLIIGFIPTLGLWCGFYLLRGMGHLLRYIGAEVRSLVGWWPVILCGQWQVLKGLIVDMKKDPRKIRQGEKK